MARRTTQIDVGSRAHRLTLAQVGGSVSDGAGGSVETPVPLTPADIWGSVEPIAAGDLERMIGGSAVEATATHIITIPFHPQVTVQTQVTYHARVFHVQGVRNVNEANITLELTCEEVLLG